MPPFTIADALAGARLASDAVVGVTNIVEAAHATVTRPGRRPTRTAGIAGLVYRLVRVAAAGVGRGIDGLAALDRWWRPVAGERPESPAREAALAVLNGVIGDTLAERGSPLATRLELRHGGRALVPVSAEVRRAVPAASDVLLVLAHGACMHDGQWRPEGAARLAQGLNATLLTLRYNSGRHISENGREFAAALQALVDAWPVPLRRVVVVGHSMGGLVARSAFHYGAAAGHAWVGLDPALVTLGAPHHGAPLERLGNLFETLLGTSRYAAPFARLGTVRSAGITDLRYGNLVDEDWAGRGRFDRPAPAPRPLPLPPGVACFVVGGTVRNNAGPLGRWVGDGLVPLDSALGQHPERPRALDVPDHRRWVADGMGHLDLVRRPEVASRLLEWLAPTVDGGPWTVEWTRA